MDEEPGAKGWGNHTEALGEAHWDTGGIGRRSRGNRLAAEPEGIPLETIRTLTAKAG